MSGKAKVWLGVAVLVIATFVGMYFASRDNRPDEVQIKEALQNSIEASREGRAGGVLEYISDDFIVSDVDFVTKRQIADLVRKSQPDVTVSTLEPVVEGDSAYIVSDVRVNGNVGVGPITRPFDQTVPDVRIEFKREDARKFLFIPVKVWKLSKVVIDPEHIPQY